MSRDDCMVAMAITSYCEKYFVAQSTQGDDLAQADLQLNCARSACKISESGKTSAKCSMYCTSCLLKPRP